MLFSARQKVDALAAGVLEVERGKKISRGGRQQVQ